MSGIDARLYPVIDANYSDIQIASDGDIETDDFFDTAMSISLFSDRRANESEVQNSFLRRGWIGNESTPGIEIGSKIWLYEQARLTRTTLNDIATVARESLQWMVEDGYAISIDAVDAVLYNNGIRLEITITRANSKVEKRFYDLWENTDFSSPTVTP